MAQGFFITLEGGEGTGKSTQVKCLAEQFRAQGHTVVETREPGGSPGAEAIRNLLLQGNKDDWTPGAEALLFAAARSSHVHKVIKPALERGEIIICDRYFDSTLAYQGGGDGLSVDELTDLHQIGSNGLFPDLTLILTVPNDVTVERLAIRDQGKSDRFGARSATYHAAVTEAFIQLTKNKNRRYIIIDADGTPESVTGRLYAAIVNAGNFKETFPDQTY